MLSTMREKTKIVMVVLALAFVGWLVFDVGMGVTGQSAGAVPDVGSVNGRPIRYQDWIEAYRVAYEQARQDNPGVNFSREEQQQIEDAAFNSLVESALIEEELQRRGIEVTDREITDAVLRFPPPEILRSPDFQTDGRFDPAKYERFLRSNNATSRQFLVALEARYREELPRFKLLQQVTSDVYIPDAKLWQIWRDTRESVTVRTLVIRPAVHVSDASVRVSPEELREYYDRHRDEFRRPARAVLSFVALPRAPTPLDSALINAHARALRDSLVRGLIDFADAARSQSMDSGSATQGGLLPRFGRGDMVREFEEAAFRAPVGQVSEPVVTQYGVHLIKVESRTRDSVTARHILFRWARMGARLDTLEMRADSLDRIAAEQTDGSMLDSASRRLGLPIQVGPSLWQGIPYVLGRFRIPDVGVWAFEAQLGSTSPVIETSGAYYVFRLDSLYAEGTQPFEEVESEVRQAVLNAKKRAAAEAIAREAQRRIAAGRTLEQVADELRLEIETIGPFTRTGSVRLLGQATPAIGAAFRLRVGDVSGMLSQDGNFMFLRAERRVAADSAAWLAQREEQRAQLTQAARQIRAQYYLQALRRAANVRDRRAEVLRQTGTTEND